MDKGINSSSCDRMIIAKKLRYGGFMCQRHLLHCLSFRIIQIFSSTLRRTNNETQVEKKPMILTSYSPSWLLNETVGTNSLKYVCEEVSGGTQDETTVLFSMQSLHKLVGINDKLQQEYTNSHNILKCNVEKQKKWECQVVYKSQHVRNK